MTFVKARLVSPFLLLGIAGGLLLIPFSPSLRLGGAMLLLFLLPGWAFPEAVFPQPVNAIERIILAGGLSYAITILAAMYLVYLPGDISQLSIVLAVAGWVIVFQTIAVFRKDRLLPWQFSNKEWLLPLAVFCVALLLRLPQLGYSEFHEDEVEVASFAARVIGGEDYALFLHRKGPVQTLIPLSIWLNTDRVTEFISRFPFALAGALGVVVVYLQARRWSNLAGAIFAGLLMAVNGLSIAFSRIVQYQSIILFLGPLAVWSFWLARETKDYRWAVTGAVLFAVCILAHFDALLYLPVILYLAWLLLKEAPAKALTLKWLAAGAVFFAAVVLSFYIPYVQDPQFRHTLTYLSDSRIGDNLLYNNLDKLNQIDRVYHSRLSLPLLFGLSLIFIAAQPKTIRAKIIAAGCLGLVVSTYWFPDIWKVNAWNVALAAWLLALGAGWLILGRFEGGRVAWIWWLTSFVGYVFLVDEPGTHYYIAYPAWAIVAGLGFGQLWQGIGKGWPLSARYVIAAGGVTVIGLLFYYQSILFWHTDSAYRQQYLAGWDSHPLRHIYKSLPASYSYFGAPRRLGWKTVGALMDKGIVQGHYRSANEIFVIPIWYTYQTPRSCFDDPDTYFVAEPGAGEPEVVQAYSLLGNVNVEGEARIALYSKQPAVRPAAGFNAADYETQFDERSQPARFAGIPPPQHPLPRQFGDVIDFRGFSLSEATLSPGETLEVTLQWQALNSMGRAYRAFVHLEKDRMWGQHDTDPACRLPTTLWRAGQVSEGQFRVMVDPVTPPGQYPLTIGLYDPESGQRLPIFDAEGNLVGDSLLLATIEIK